MLKNILNTDPEKRFTIQQIRDHDWYKQHSETKYDGIIVGQDQIPVEDNLLGELDQYISYDFDI